jgi:hypothetical protein
MEYGTLDDFWILYRKLGIENIVSIARDFTSLDPKSMSLLVALSGKNQEYFKCYTTKQQIPPHWNF